MKCLGQGGHWHCATGGNWDRWGGRCNSWSGGRRQIQRQENVKIFCSVKVLLFSQLGRPVMFCLFDSNIAKVLWRFLKRCFWEILTCVYYGQQHNGWRQWGFADSAEERDGGKLQCPHYNELRFDFSPRWLFKCSPVPAITSPNPRSPAEHRGSNGPSVLSSREGLFQTNPFQGGFSRLW